MGEEIEMPTVDYRASYHAASAELKEARQRAERAERLSEARLLVLKQYVAHHSGCGECYKVWVDVWVTDPGVVPLAADPKPAEAGGEPEPSN